MKIFLSYAAYDQPVAHFLKESLSVEMGVSFWMMSDDTPPGTVWSERIKMGIEKCDAIYSIVTPESVGRPWITAEWASFWILGKPTTPLLIDVKVERLWEPMRAFQSVILTDVSSVMRFLKALSGATGNSPVDGTRRLANEITQEIPLIRERQALGDIERAITRVGSRLRSGTPNIDPLDIRTLLSHDRLEELLSMVESDEATSVKQRQAAVALVNLGRYGEAASIAVLIKNRNEARTVCMEIVRRIPRGATEASDEWQALDRVFPRLGRPQIRDVLEGMEQAGVAPLGPWASGESLADDAP
ncbi:toll/interleukin-1 receptor domain-containing protein [Actinomadura madurae]|uniref:toll/interleukin-1 receptor domain-containing protein n=1 Tax=Actinomadura madurae TaxID=1993 RepID=UPI000D9AA073|nr:toll/interleukin-1 receptor domain-containing protein [Actinomadura madurae]SPT52065.1 Uncharacterised protein [Actinomadura madurae]